MAIAQATIVPIGTGSTSVSKYVADCHKILQDEKRIKYELTPMATVFEGDLDVILEVIRKMHEVPFQNGAKRVITSISIDDRRDKDASMSQKLNSVKEKL
ncbi:MAG: MTH1187 family thiamine-binding protein [Clostridium sp.]|uniref:MTH1187 family thiamine-binding protein n=1 Tax=Clostridium sp. TaxID=1506 RepID=UPI0025C4F4B3|nr:MTH1187 family thiamine-binding protein [Clostridium sp.]MCH3964874.1 MTH1187 family thiamine-binding protein [Clostridium sp.]MCI1716631.1 MTH1187 family thiamine-binding protein [Clostridium sp.]MCI1800887.1 MTH1187 family thiamine-binding protein [Clostridium sp.]MCI1814808.1 MTH1187 family thiamine-binding protein [Clostridium sp.]MCI1871634.1 MTH1187 family thiamine-binding protein [Clostridium sp.]